jgi:hypothetical protein
MTTPTVIIESDSLDAWLGLIGVIMGVAITTVTSWLQNRRHDHTEQQRELQGAKGQLVASATSIVILVGWYHGARTISPNSSLRNTLGTESEWVEKITNAIERLQIADQVIQRYGQRDTAQASSRVVSESTDLARGKTSNPQGVNDAITSFKMCDANDIPTIDKLESKRLQANNANDQPLAQVQHKGEATTSPANEPD